MFFTLAEMALATLVFAAGVFIVVTALLSTIRTFILPRSARDPISAFAFRNIRRLFELRLRRMPTYEARDRVMALYAPVSLFLLLPLWLTLLTVGYTLMFWATGVRPWTMAIRISGSSLLTLGYASDEQFFHTLLEFSEAALGLMLIALLIAYLPTMYTAFSKREVAVTQLDVRAGSPPSAVEFILRNHRIGNLEKLNGFWAMWETWFADVEESHTSLAALVFFRSPQPEYSWITAAGAVLDSAALIAAAVDIPREPQAELCLRAGYLALQRIADFFDVPYEAKPHFPDHPISVSRWEFDAICQELAADGVPLKADREQAWQDFGGWRVNYDRPLIAISTLVMAPYAPWSSDRSLADSAFPRDLRFVRRNFELRRKTIEDGR